MYRRTADAVVGRTVSVVEANDSFFVKGGATPADVVASVTGRKITRTDRIGKLLLLDLDDEPGALGLRFGMTGRIVVDDVAAIDELQYSSGRDDPAWDRFALQFSEGGRLRINDPRRLGGVELAPDTSRLGVDLFAVTPKKLAAALAPSSVALKARLLDQKRIAGIGNLIADETLWKAGIDPARLANSLDEAEVRKLSSQLKRTVRRLYDAGGSHTGDLQPARVRGGLCPADGAPLLRRQLGGRTTYSCPEHQH